ncbi:MAG: hypothetical protein R2875_12375 [Desulfobacterales bacterium]
MVKKIMTKAYPKNIKWMSIVSAVLGLALTAPASATWNLSGDGDLRYVWQDWEHSEANVHLIGASVRKTFADSHGDRFIFFGLVEAADNLMRLWPMNFMASIKAPWAHGTSPPAGLDYPGDCCPDFPHRGFFMICP